MGNKKLNDQQLVDKLQRILQAKERTEKNIAEGKGDRQKLFRFLGELFAERSLVLEEMRRRTN